MERDQLNNECERCKLLEARVAQLERQVAALLAEIARLRKDSSNSSKPPSSDIVKPTKSPTDGKRKRGGRPGHPRSVRPPFPPEQVDEVHSHRLDCCPDCGGQVEPAGAEPRVVQQIEVVERPIRVHEHRGCAVWCGRCRKVHYAKIPQPIERAGLVGSRLTAWIAYLKGGCHASFSTIRRFLRDVIGAKLSRSQLAKIVAKVSAALAAPWNELFGSLPEQKQVSADETRHKDDGVLMWTWVFRAPDYTLFQINGKRDAVVLLDALGCQFNGVLGCDYFGAYRRYMNACDVRVQFCLAHLIRDVKFLATLPDRQAQAYGERLRESLRRLFGVIHRREELPPSTFQLELRFARIDVERAATSNVPANNHCRNLAQRFHNHGKAYFEFITTPGVEPTNNLAEQAIRFVVIDRLVTQGTRGEVGRRWSERIWTAMATCAQQGRSAFEYLASAIDAYLNGKVAPSLLPQPP